MLLYSSVCDFYFAGAWSVAQLLGGCTGLISVPERQKKCCCMNQTAQDKLRCPGLIQGLRERQPGIDRQRSCNSKDGSDIHGRNS
jgi:hypothetical protein